LSVYFFKLGAQAVALSPDASNKLLRGGNLQTGSCAGCSHRSRGP